MEIFSLEFITSLAIIILIDLVLAGDNAIVIGLAARNVPVEHQKKVIIWGTTGAIMIRVIATLLVLELLSMPWIHLVGGVLLVWIAYKLLVEEKSHEIDAKSSVFAAIRTIIIADAAMGVDNVIAVAGAAHGNVLLVILGLLISVPIMIWGSSLLVKWMNKHAWIIYVGAGVLAWTAGKMLTGEVKLQSFFTAYPIIKWSIIILVVIGVLVAGKWVNDRKQSFNTNQNKSSSA